MKVSIPPNPPPKTTPDLGAASSSGSIGYARLRHGFAGGDEEKLADAVETANISSVEIILGVVSLDLTGDASPHA